MKQTIRTSIAALASAALFASTPAIAQDNSASDNVAVNFNVNVEEAVTLTFNGDITIDQIDALFSPGVTSGYQGGCMGLTVGDTVDVTVSGSTQPDGASYFYLQGPDGVHIRYFVFMDTGESFTPLFDRDLQNGATQQAAIPQDVIDNSSDSCGAAIPVNIVASIYDNGYVLAPDDTPTSTTVFEGVNAAKLVLPTGDNAFSDTLTITVAPALVAG